VVMGPASDKPQVPPSIPLEVAAPSTERVTEPTDVELVERINSGDPAAFEALYRRYRDWVVRLAYRFTGHRDDALDVLQEAFTYLLGRFPGFQLTAAMTTFLYPVVKHLSLRARRKRGRFVSDEDVLANLPGPAPMTEAGTTRAELAPVLASLPEPHREVLLMRYVDGLTLQEVADALGVPLGTVKSRLHNALRTLREDDRTRRYFEPR
jgi:RNA polymerase sigma-70 factor, ECF subfamily